MKNQKELLNEEIQKFRKLAGIKKIIKESIIEEGGTGSPEAEIVCGLVDIAAHSAEKEMFMVKGRNITPLEIKTIVRKGSYLATPEELEVAREVFDNIFKDAYMIQVAGNAFKEAVPKVGYNFIEFYVEHDLGRFTNDVEALEMIQKEIKTVKPVEVNWDEETFNGNYEEEVSFKTEEDQLDDIANVQPEKSNWIKKTWATLKEVFSGKASEETSESLIQAIEQNEATVTAQLDTQIKKQTNPKKKAALQKQKTDFQKKTKETILKLREQDMKNQLDFRKKRRNQELEKGEIDISLKNQEKQKGETDISLKNIEVKKAKIELWRARMAIVGDILKGLLKLTWYVAKIILIGAVVTAFIAIIWQPVNWVGVKWFGQKDQSAYQFIKQKSGDFFNKQPADPQNQ